MADVISQTAWMRILIATGVACGFFSAEAEAQVPFPYLVKPSTTTPGIDPDFDRFHYCYRPADDIDRRNQLVVFLPGTGGLPSAYQGFLKAASALGFHAIGLSYVNGESMGSYCGDAETAGCFEQARREVIDGIDRNPDVHVDRANSIENRIIQLLRNLTSSRGDESWRQFLTGDGTSVNWSKVLITGHSQGGGHAGVIAMHNEVARVLIFAATDWWNDERRPADWMAAEGVTPKSRYYALGHERDLLVFQNRMLAGMNALGLGAFGAVQAPETPSGIYFGGTHHLMTNVDPRIPTLLLDAHSAMIVDVYTPLDAEGVSVMQPAWVSMLTAPNVPPAPTVAIEQMHSTDDLSIQVPTQVGFLYQLQESTALIGWRNSGAVSVGERESPHARWLIPRRAFKDGFWRVSIRYQ